MFALVVVRTKNSVCMDIGETAKDLIAMIHACLIQVTLVWLSLDQAPVPCLGHLVSIFGITYVYIQTWSKTDIRLSKSRHKHHPHTPTYKQSKKRHKVI